MLYRPYVKAAPGLLAFTSGQLPIVPDQEDLPGSFAEQAAAALANVLKLVESENGSKSNFVKLTIFMTDLSYFDEFNQIYAKFFEGITPPARTCIEVSRLPRNALLEIEAVFSL